MRPRRPVALLVRERRRYYPGVPGPVPRERRVLGVYLTTKAANERAATAELPVRVRRVSRGVVHAWQRRGKTP